MTTAKIRQFYFNLGRNTYRKMPSVRGEKNQKTWEVVSETSGFKIFAKEHRMTLEDLTCLEAGFRHEEEISREPVKH